MKYSVSLLLPLFLLTLAACDNATNKTKVNTAVRDSTKIAGAVKDTVEGLPDGCTGARPDQPIVDSIKYPHRRFRYENRIGYNDFVTSVGDSITIEQSNCDYATYRFIVRSSHEYDSSLDTAILINKAADILEGIESDIKLTVALDTNLYYLRKSYAVKNKPVNEEIDFNSRPESSWRNVVIANSVEKKKQCYIVIITCYDGPL